MNRRDFLQTSSLSLLATPFISGNWFSGKRRVETDLLIWGAGASGLCAGIQAARMGINVMIIEPTVWIGGMLTSAGVSALDGNKWGAGGGLVKEFRDKLLTHYNEKEQIFTGWISLYCYEPKIGQDKLQELAKPLSNLKIVYESDVVKYEKGNGRDRKITVRHKNGETSEIVCQIFMDATEYGDGMKLAGVKYRLGRESKDEYGENVAPDKSDMEMQDLTYAATLVKKADGKPMPNNEIEQAYWEMFDCSTALDCKTPDKDYLNHSLHTWESFISYAALPNNKYLLNWPHHSNDYPITEAFFEDKFYRNYVLHSAKLHTLQFVKYMQTKLNHPEWQLATDEYPTSDHLPMIPYMRESRRLVNQHVFKMQDTLPIGSNPRAPFLTNSIAVGDYYIDHHHSKSHLPPDERLREDYPDNKAFQIPPTVFFPENGDDSFVVGEKSIAVSHIANGCTRLQPTVMLMGQALGAISALAIQQNKAPASVDMKGAQQELLKAGSQLYILYDVPFGNPLFDATQQLALRGVFRDDDATKLEADKPITADLVRKWTQRANLPALTDPNKQGYVQKKDFNAAFKAKLGNTSGDVTKGAFVKTLYDLMPKERNYIFE